MPILTRLARPADAAAILRLNAAFDDVRASVEHIAEHIAAAIGDVWSGT